jgi:serine phosphatase RsbU (regulator of sigma subunit)
MGVFFVDTIQRRRLIKAERERAAVREARLRAKALEIQNERQARELEEARELQLSMLPTVVPDHPSVDIEAYMKTATEVGGDYYDFHVSDDGTLTVAIGDATDHGARAGTMVTAVKSLFNILVEDGNLDNVMARATNALKRMQLGQLYMAMAMVKIEESTMRIAGAGMPEALIHRAATNQLESVSMSGMPLGSLTEYPYEVSDIQLQPNDTVLLMSDGFAERFSPDGEMFGYERAKEAFFESASGSPAEIVAHLVQISDKWAKNDAQTDDMTFVVMKAKSDIKVENPLQ